MCWLASHDLWLNDASPMLKIATEAASKNVRPHLRSCKSFTGQTKFLRNGKWIEVREGIIS